jgi:hypothetical protein
MISSLVRDLKEESLEKSSRWVANAVVNGISHNIPKFNEQLSDSFKKNIELRSSVRTKVIKEFQTKLDDMLDYYETSTDIEACFFIDLVDGKMIYHDVDVEICYQLGCCLSQMNGKELSIDFVHKDYYQMRLEATKRAFTGEVVDYIGRGANGTLYTVCLTPILENGKTVSVKGVCKFPDEKAIDYEKSNDEGLYIFMDYVDGNYYFRDVHPEICY